MAGFQVVVLLGDGFGPRLMEQAVRVAAEVCAIEGVALDCSYENIGYAAYESEGTPFSGSTAQKCRAASAILLGPVGDKRADGLAPHVQPSAGVRALRAKLGLFTELCPVLIPEKAVDLLLVRELCGGIYYGPRGHTKVEEVDAAFDTELYTEPEVERVAKQAFELARKRRGQVVSVDRADVLESSRLWRGAVEKTAKGYPDVSLSHISVNRAAALVLSEPAQFDVLLTSNLFGSILASEAAAHAGESGALARAFLGYSRQGAFTPACSTDTRSPMAAILAAGMMFHYSFDMPSAAEAVSQAVREVNERAQGLEMEQVTELVMQRVRRILA